MTKKILKVAAAGVLLLGIAAAVIYAISQPDRVDVNEILIRPTTQPL